MLTSVFKDDLVDINNILEQGFKTDLSRRHFYSSSFTQYLTQSNELLAKQKVMGSDLLKHLAQTIKFADNFTVHFPRADYQALNIKLKTLLIYISEEKGWNIASPIKPYHAERLQHSVYLLSAIWHAVNKDQLFEQLPELNMALSICKLINQHINSSDCNTEADLEEQLQYQRQYQTFLDELFQAVKDVLSNLPLPSAITQSAATLLKTIQEIAKNGQLYVNCQHQIDLLQPDQASKSSKQIEPAPTPPPENLVVASEVFDSLKLGQSQIAPIQQNQIQQDRELIEEIPVPIINIANPARPITNSSVSSENHNLPEHNTRKSNQLAQVIQQAITTYTEETDRQLTSLQTELQQLKQANSVKIEQLTDALQQKEAEHTQLQHDYAELNSDFQQQVEQLTHERNALQTLLAFQEKSNHELNIALIIAKKDIAKVENKVNDYQTELAGLRHLHQEKMQEHDNQSDTHQSFTQQINQLTKERDSYLNKLATQEENTHVLSAAYCALKKKHDDIESEAYTHQAKIEKLIITYQEKEQDYQSISQQLPQAKQENLALKEELAKANSHLNELGTLARTVEIQAKNTWEQNSHLTERVGMLESENHSLIIKLAAAEDRLRAWDCWYQQPSPHQLSIQSESQHLFNKIGSNGVEPVSSTKHTFFTTPAPSLSSQAPGSIHSESREVNGATYRATPDTQTRPPSSFPSSNVEASPHRYHDATTQSNRDSRKERAREEEHDRGLSIRSNSYGKRKYVEDTYHRSRDDHSRGGSSRDDDRSKYSRCR